MGFPIKLNGERVNTVKPLWMSPKGSITDAEHKDFYQFLSKSYDEPLYNIHFTSDSPLSIRSIFYIPEQHTEKYGMGKMEPGVSLFSRKILIQGKIGILLPEWLRFIKGQPEIEIKGKKSALANIHPQELSIVRMFLYILAENIYRTPSLSKD